MRGIQAILQQSLDTAAKAARACGSSPIFCVNLSRPLVMALLALVKVTDLRTRFGSPE